ncbi:MAG TPA: hypothetical protein VIL86_07455 [Tepidisphaeraceae bacterium]|jgi:hypothetical protein
MTSRPDQKRGIVHGQLVLAQEIFRADSALFENGLKSEGVDSGVARDGCEPTIGVFHNGMPATLPFDEAESTQGADDLGAGVGISQV